MEVVEDTILDMLALKAREADVQTLALVSILTRGRIEIHEEWQTKWVYGYIELLRRHQLHNEATAIIKLSKGPISGINTEASIGLTCSRCGHSAQDPRGGEKGFVCKHCRLPMTKCAICQVPVRGLYVWCQGCGHGGHFKHMMEWFSSKWSSINGVRGICPTGCLHQCHRDDLVFTSMNKIGGTVAPVSLRSFGNVK